MTALRVLVLGRSGQLASSLAAIAPDYPGFALRFAGRPETDLVDPASVERAISLGTDIVINTAAYTDVDGAESEPALAASINADGAAAAARAARKVGARFVQVSTDYVFDGAKAGPYAEGDPTGPLGTYGRTKLEGEMAVRDAGGQSVILRTAWLYGPFGRNFAKAILGAAGKGAPLRVVADQSGSPTSTVDLAVAILTLIERWRAPMSGEIFHVAGAGPVVSRHGFATEILKASAAVDGPSVTVEPIASGEWPTPAVRPRNSALDCSKLERTFGIALPDWRTSVAALVRDPVRGEPSGGNRSA